MTNNPIWTEEQINIIKNNYQDKTYKELSQMIGRSYKAIIDKCTKEGYYAKIKNSNKWTKIETKFLIERSMFETIKQLKIVLPKHTEKSIRNKIKRKKLLDRKIFRNS